jgi:16S rRNA (cytidine1402-2'-O)-methyltransferase
MSKFFVVATPIGNLGDITLRALEVLKSVDLILCEDTRVTKKLLDKYEIKTPTMSYHARSKISKIEKIFELLRTGKNLALVSDAGTPTISDPGATLISRIKEEFNLTPDPSSSKREERKRETGVQVIPIPGVTAIITALSASGLPTHEFTFLGFLPHKKGR